MLTGLVGTGEPVTAALQAEPTASSAAPGEQVWGGGPGPTL